MMERRSFIGSLAALFAASTVNIDLPISTPVPAKPLIPLGFVETMKFIPKNGPSLFTSRSLGKVFFPEWDGELEGFVTLKGQLYKIESKIEKSIMYDYIIKNDK